MQVSVGAIARVSLPGQPWRRRIGIAFGFCEKRAAKWMLYDFASSSLTSTLKFGMLFIAAS